MCVRVCSQCVVQTWSWISSIEKATRSCQNPGAKRLPRKEKKLSSESPLRDLIKRFLSKLLLTLHGERLDQYFITIIMAFQMILDISQRKLNQICVCHLKFTASLSLEQLWVDLIAACEMRSCTWSDIISNNEPFPTIKQYTVLPIGETVHLLTCCAHHVLVDAEVKGRCINPPLVTSCPPASDMWMRPRYHPFNTCPMALQSADRWRLGVTIAETQ